MMARSSTRSDSSLALRGTSPPRLSCFSDVPEPVELQGLNDRGTAGCYASRSHRLVTRPRWGLRSSELHPPRTCTGTFQTLGKGSGSTRHCGQVHGGDVRLDPNR